jgi:hypothetical protein
MAATPIVSIHKHHHPLHAPAPEEYDPALHKVHVVAPAPAVYVSALRSKLSWISYFFTYFPLLSSVNADQQVTSDEFSCMLRAVL